MANIRGFFMNLDGCLERRERLEGNLRELGMSQRHERFAAIRTHAHVDFSPSRCFASPKRNPDLSTPAIRILMQKLTTLS
jgi:hypothetical protein